MLPLRDGSRQRRLARSVLLGAVAAFAGIAWLASGLGMDSGELWGFAAGSALLVLAVVVAALVAAALLRAVKRLLGRG